MIGLTIEELAVGDQARMTRTITRETIREFVDATGDDNPIHSDPRFAAGTRFGQVIAPGILTGGLLSAVIGTRLPGPGVLYLSQTFRFLQPVLIGDAITARVAVAEVVRERNRVRLVTGCVNQRDETVLEGEAWVMPSRAHVEYAEAPAGRAALASLACVPATLALRLASFWLAGALALTAHTLERPRPAGASPR